MKKLLFPILLFLISCESKTPQNNLKTLGLIGKVKSIDENTYSAIEKFGEVQKNENKSNYLVEFNINGNIIEVTKKPSHSRTIYKYDSQEYLIERHEYRPIETLYRKVISKYNNQGNEIETRTYYPKDTTEYLEIHKYNESGYRIETESYSRGKPNGKDIFKYDENGNNIEYHIYDHLGDLIQKDTYKFDENGNKIDFISSHKMDDFKIKGEKFKFDEEENIIETEHFDDEGLLWLNESMKFDEFGNEIEMISTYYKGDEQKEHIEKKLYEYDSKNNWIKKIEYNTYYMITIMYYSNAFYSITTNYSCSIFLITYWNNL